MKRALILASVASMIDQFNMNNIQLLLDAGYRVEVIANFENGNTISQDRIMDLKKRLKEKEVDVCHVPIPRSIFDIKGILSSLKIVEDKCNSNLYTLVHCHSPIGGVIARMAARKARNRGTKVIYTAHGFHFYKGAPIKNWILFYPIEKICSLWTDILVTINKEDFIFAKSHMEHTNVKYVPGVGVDTETFREANTDKRKKREELNIPAAALVLFAVGELNRNKNHEVIVRALGMINNDKIHYVIAGKGNCEKALLELASEKNVNLHLLGYRTDVTQLYQMADIFVFPSLREGLSVSLMEAMASGLPCVVSRIRGNIDLIDSKGGYFHEPDDIRGFANSIRILIDNPDLRQKFQCHNQKIIRKYDVKEVNEMMKEIYFGNNSNK